MRVLIDISFTMLYVVLDYARSMNVKFVVIMTFSLILINIKKNVFSFEKIVMVI